MKINSTVLLTLILLTLMLGAGSVSGLLGFNLGSSALKGVTTPDGRPTTKFASNKISSAQPGEVALLSEKEIIKIVKSRMNDKAISHKQEQEEDEEDTDNDTKPKEKPKVEAEDKPQPGFPIISEDQGVTFSVMSARYSGGDLLIKVKMQNKGADSVRFLYSFLDVTDDKGQTLSAITEGLPTELSANGTPVSGTVTIPTASLDDVKKISMSLTDYPNQELNLEVLNIPIGK